MDKFNDFKPKRIRRNPNRLLIEGLILSFTGISLALYLNQIPDKFILNDFILSTWTNLSLAFMNLFDAIIQIAKATSVIFLIIISTLFIISGFIRLYKYIILKLRYKIKNPNRDIFFKRNKS